MYLPREIKLMLCNSAATTSSSFRNADDRGATLIRAYSIARTISSVIFLASLNSIMVLSV
jgi:hypothetical protein